VQQAELQTIKDKLSRTEAELDRTRHNWAQLQATLAESRQKQSDQLGFNLILRKRFEEQLAKMKMNYEKNLLETTDSLIRCQKKRDYLQ
jgi:TATA-binding protein-associated factor Taf7